MTDLPAHDTAAEQSTLGSMLLSREAISTVTELLKPNHFYNPNHETIYGVIVHLVGEGQPVDAVTVAAELGKIGVLQRIGGAPYLHTLIAGTPTPASAGSYARVVFDKARQRAIARVGHKLVSLGTTEASSSDDVDALLAQADDMFRELGGPAHKGLTWDQLVTKWRNWREGESRMIPTPWPDINTMFNGGMAAGQMIIIGGRPGAGKSVSGLNVALGAAEQGHRVTVFSVEMDDVEVASRLLAAGSWASQAEIMSGKMKQETRDRVEDYISARKGLPLELVDQAYITVEQIIAHCRLRRPELIFVDYAQLIAPSNNKLVREQQVAHITRSLKVAAKHLQMVVVVAAQLNRGSADGSRVPLISDLRESGAAEQDADIVMLLHQPPDDDGVVQLIVGKNRNGPTGVATLIFRRALGRVG